MHDQPLFGLVALAGRWSRVHNLHSRSRGADVAITGRVVSGLQALDVVVSDHGGSVHAIVTREALEERWPIGPKQEDLLQALRNHSDEIEQQVIRCAQTSGKRLVVLYNMGPAAWAGDRGKR